ncbi:MAG: hypothetical protein MUF54_00210 [Polyangiaceae bacterium]|jgi:hypothetical protein|nr:hypothetical protein [Polyangiaceae bacterium]
MSRDLVVQALQALDWKFVQESEQDTLSVTFQAHSAPSIKVTLKLAGQRMVATTAIDIQLPRAQWAEVLVSANEYNATQFRPKVYLAISGGSDTALLFGEEVFDGTTGTTVEHLAAWTGAHASAFAMASQNVLGVKLG